MAALDYLIASRFLDYDARGYAHDRAFFPFLEEARSRLWDEPVAPGSRYRDLRAPGGRIVVAAQRVDYRVPLRREGEQPVRVRLRVVHVGTTSCRLGFEIADARGATIYAVGETVLVETTSSGRPSPFTAAQKICLEAWRNESFHQAERGGTPSAVSYRDHESLSP